MSSAITQIAQNNESLAGQIESQLSAATESSAVEMNAGSGVILKKVVGLAGVSQKVRDRSDSIDRTAEEINGSVTEMVSNTGANKEAIDTLFGGYCNNLPFIYAD